MPIAYDNSSKGDQGSGATLTFSHTTGSGSNRLLLVQAHIAEGTLNGITYNGVSLTSVANVTGGDMGTTRGVLFRLINPDTGTYNVVITQSSSNSIEGAALSYTGVHQTAPVNATHTSTALNTGTSRSVSVTSTVTDCWGVWCARDYAGGALTNGANTVLRQHGTTQFSSFVTDTNSAQATGVITQTLTKTGSGNWIADIVVSIAPSADVAIAHPAFLSNFM